MTDQRSADTLRVEAAFATPAKQRIVQLRVLPGTTAREVALASGLAAEFAGLDLATVPLGLFGVRVADRHIVAEGDRVELYRPLPQDPRQARRDAAAAGGTLGRSPP